MNTETDFVRKVLLLVILCLFLSPLASSEELPVGLWWIKHGDGEPLQVRLYQGGAAWSDYPSNNPGSWTYQDDRVVCVWADGWKDVFVRADGRWSKLSYGPRTELSEPPTSRSHAFHITSAPDGWFGVGPKR